MKRTLTMIICAIFAINFAFAQWQTDAPKSQIKMKSTKNLSVEKGINEISGGITSLTNYIPGINMVLNFELTIASPDYEYMDGLSMTFPAGITPIVTGTSDPITANTGCGNATGQLNPIVGQTITWGEITTPTDCGYLDEGVYTFSVGVTIGAITGSQSITYTVFGDGYGAAPNSFGGTVVVNEAAADDVGVASIDLGAFYQPATTVTPMVTVQNYGTAVQTFDVSLVFNNGTTDVYTQTETVTALAPGATQQVSFTDWTTVDGNYTATATTLLTGDAVAANDTKTHAFLVTSAFTAYAWSAYDPASVLPNGPVDILIPAGTVTSIVTDADNFMAGADFVYNQWFGAQYNASGNSNIYTINYATGVKTLVGPSGAGLTGLAFDVTSGKLYASAYADPNSLLYTVNTGSGAATLVGNMNSTGLVIGIACNNNGDLFGITLNDDLVSINKTTGVATVVGPLGVDINYAQDIAFDRDNDVLYGTLYTTTGILAEINTTTGAATTLATFGAELTGFAIPYQFTLPDNDVMVQSITAIPSGCGLSNAQQIQIRVANIGNDAQSNIPVYYTINGGTQVTGTVAGPIAGGAYADYTFTTTADLSTFGNYVIVACTDLTGDDNPGNDCSTINVTNVQPATVPYTMGFESTENIASWSFQDVNNDSYTWDITEAASLARTGTGVAIYEYNSASAANDWMFTTCINLIAGTDYQLDFWYKVGAWQGTTYPEKLKVAVGTAPNATAMTQVIHDLGTINNTTYVKDFSTFTVPTTGTYYLGWHAYSAADMFYIAIDDVSLTIASDVESIENQNNINIYPNPTKNQLNINATSTIDNIKVYNAMGQLVINSKIDSQFHTLNTSDYTFGVYFIQIETRNGIVNKRFVIAE